MLSGRHPSHTGIVADKWYDVETKKLVFALDDPKQTTLGGSASSSSPVNFLGTSLPEVLKKRSPQSQVVSVSLKDRAAIFLAGRSGDAAYWYDTNAGNFVTSSYYVREVPSWLEKWNSQHFADQFAGKLWTRLLADENDPVGQAEAPELAGAVKKLSERQQEIFKITRDIVLGKNQ